MSNPCSQPEPHGAAGARDVKGAWCRLCNRFFARERGLQVHLRFCRKRSDPVLSNVPTDGRGAVASGVPVAARLGEPVVRLERCDDARRGLKRPRRASRRQVGDSGSRGFAARPPSMRGPGTTGGAMDHVGISDPVLAGGVNQGLSFASAATESVTHNGETHNGVLTNGGANQGLSFASATTESETHGGVLTDGGANQGLSFASATTVNGSSDGLPLARSTAGGAVYGLGTLTADCQDGLSFARSASVVSQAGILTTGNCVEGLSFALPHAGGDCQDGLSSARSIPVASQSSITGGGVVGLVPGASAEHGCQGGLSIARPAVVSHTVASARLLPSGDMPSSRSPPGSGGDQSRSGQEGVYACSSCCSSFGSLRGLRVHERRRHPADYHAGLAIGHRTGTKRRWGHEEKVLVARQELLFEADGKGNLNSRLAMTFPSRSFESIKSLRKIPAYRALLDGIRNNTPAGPTRPSASANVCDQTGGEGGGTSDPTIPSNPVVACNRLVEACRADVGCLCLSSDEFREVIDLAGGTVRDSSVAASGRIQELVDLEYSRWVTKLDFSGAQSSSNTQDRSDDRGPVRNRRRRGTRGLSDGAARPPSKRTLRRRLYGVMQTLYKKNRSRCAKTVLSGDWAKERRAAKPGEQEAYWRPLFEEPSKPDEREPEPVCRPLFEMSLPVTMEEYERSLGSTHDSSPGLDGVDLKLLRKIAPRTAVAHMNLWLLAGRPPGAFKIGVTVPIPKSADAVDPSEYRPITVSPMLCRLFHRLVARRAEATLPLGARQKAFREGDGLADNVWILRSLIEDCKTRHRPLCVTFVDVRKAFDTVSHESVVKAAERIGFPPALVSYIRCLYTGGVTQLRVGRSLGGPIHPSRGVRQGDPLSPLLFCAVMHWVLSQLDDRLGLELGEGLLLNHLAFADDVALVSSSPEAMGKLLCELESGMRAVGLRPNGAKSASLRIAVSGKAKKWFCSPEPYLSLDGTPVPPLDIAGSYRYLGIKAGAGPLRTGTEVTRKLEEGIRQLSKAPLKPQQRLFFLRVHLLPSLYHELVLGVCSKGLLRHLDRCSRRAVRQWLRLVHDVPQPFFHAGASDGGLGIPELLVQVPLMRRARVEKLFDRATWLRDPVMVAVIGKSKALRKERQRWTNGVPCYNQVVTDRISQGRSTATALYQSCDGCGLADNSQVPSVNRWVTSGTSVMSGRSFINALHVRAGCLYTRVRASRGRTPAPSGAADVACEVCPCRRESLSHVIQQCPRSAHARTKRHDAVLKLLSTGLTKRGFTVEVEPAIKTDNGVRRPDVVAYKPGTTAVIVDVTVVADLPGELPDAHARKCRKYDVPDVRKWVSERAGVSTASVTVTALTFNWRGALCLQSAQSMGSLGIPMSTLELMSIRVLEWGHTAWRESRDATWLRIDSLPSCPGRLRQHGSRDCTSGSTRRHFMGLRPPVDGQGPSASRAGGRRSFLRGPERREAAGICP